MLPFLKPRLQTGVAVVDHTLKPEEKNEPNHGLIACAEELIRAVKAEDASAVATAFRIAFDLLELEPHEEIEHEKSE